MQIATWGCSAVTLYSLISHISYFWVNDPHKGSQGSHERPTMTHTNVHAWTLNLDQICGHVLVIGIFMLSTQVFMHVCMVPFVCVCPCSMSVFLCTYICVIGGMPRPVCGLNSCKWWICCSLKLVSMKVKLSHL